MKEALQPIWNTYRKSFNSCTDPTVLRIIITNNYGHKTQSWYYPWYICVHQHILRAARSGGGPICWSVDKDHSWWVWCLLQTWQSLCCTSTIRVIIDGQNVVLYIYIILYYIYNIYIFCSQIVSLELILLTYLIKYVIDICCSLCRSFHKEKTILLSINLCFLQKILTFIQKLKWV